MTIRTLIFAAILIGGVYVTGNANAILETYEEAIEASTLDVSIPSTPSGSLVVRHCLGCQVLTLTLTSDTRFYVGKQQVALQDFRDAATSGTRGLTILYFPESLQVTRLLLSAHAD